MEENASMFYLPLAIQLHNDESAKCKKLAWLALKSLLAKLSVEKRDTLFELTMAMFGDESQPLHKRIASLLVKLYADVEGAAFERRVSATLATLRTELASAAFTSSSQMQPETPTTQGGQLNTKFYDQYLNNLLTLLARVLVQCPFLLKHSPASNKHVATVNQLFAKVSVYLTHEHSWVRLSAAQLFGMLFAAHGVRELLDDAESFFNTNNNKHLIVRDLIDSFCTQLKSPILDSQLAEQVIKNLAFMAKLLVHGGQCSKMEADEAEEEDEVDENEQLKHDLSVSWLIKKVTREANYELVNKPKETIKRTFIFKWLAAVALELAGGDKQLLVDHLHLMVPCVQRELVVGETDEALKRLAHEVLELIKQTVGMDEYTRVYSLTTKRRADTREQRKRKLAQTAVLDPQLAAAKKIRKMQRKKEARKRKLATTKLTGSSSSSKKRKIANNHDDDDDDF